MVEIAKDSKSRCLFVSHKRCGMTEGIWLTPEELEELRVILNGTRRGDYGKDALVCR